MIDILGGQRQPVTGKADHLLAELQGIDNLRGSLRVCQHRLQRFTLAHQRQVPLGGLAVVTKLAAAQKGHACQRGDPQ